MFGGLNTRRAEGPWPECLNINGEACVDLLKMYTEGISIELMQENVNVLDDFQPNRVRIYVSASNVVVAVPQRG